MVYNGLTKNEEVFHMALINCPECQKEVSDQAASCPNCGFSISKKKARKGLYNDNNIPNKPNRTSSKFRRVIVFGCIGMALLLLGAISYDILSPHSLEKEAQKYVKTLKKIENVKTINDVVCITKKYYKDEHISYGYLINFNGNEFAYFDKGTYKGNGYNGGNGQGNTKAFYKLHSLMAQELYAEFLLFEVTPISLKDAKNDKEGLIILDIDKIVKSSK